MSATQYIKRGFAFIEFDDASGTACNIQKSSLATDDAIWIGAKEIGLKKFTPYVGWEGHAARGTAARRDLYCQQSNAPDARSSCRVAAHPNPFR